MVDTQMEGWMEERLRCLMVGQINKWMDGQMDGQTEMNWWNREVNVETRTNTIGLLLETAMKYGKWAQNLRMTILFVFHRQCPDANVTWGSVHMLVHFVCAWSLIKAAAVCMPAVWDWVFVYVAPGETGIEFVSLQ